MAVNTRTSTEVADALGRWLGAAHPEVGPARITGVEAPADGGSSETYFVDIRLNVKSGFVTERWVLRIEARGNQVYEDPSVERQFRTLEILGRTGAVPVPRVLWFEDDPRVFGAPFYLMEFVRPKSEQGDPFSRRALEAATPADRERLWLNAVASLAAVHRTDPAPFDFLGLPQYGSDGVAQELGRWDRYRDWARIPPHAALDRARNWLNDHQPRGGGLAWGDARPGNMLFEDGRCVAVLDWETASLGGAETDLGWWLCFDHLANEGAGLSRLEGIGGAEAMVAAWEGFAGRKAVAVEWHEVFATYRLALICERSAALAAMRGQSAAGARRGDANPCVPRLIQLAA